MAPEGSDNDNNVASGSIPMPVDPVPPVGQTPSPTGPPDVQPPTGGTITNPIEGGPLPPGVVPSGGTVPPVPTGPPDIQPPAGGNSGTSDQMPWDTPIHSQLHTPAGQPFSSTPPTTPSGNPLPSTAGGVQGEAMRSLHSHDPNPIKSKGGGPIGTLPPLNQTVGPVTLSDGHTVEASGATPTGAGGGSAGATLLDESKGALPTPQTSIMPDYTKGNNNHMPG